MSSPDHPVNPPNQGFISIAKSKEKGDKVEIEPLPVTNIPMANGFKINPINVKKSEKYHESQNPNMGCYYSKSRKRGVCLFFNNIEYVNNKEEKREGAEIDQENLKVLFSQIGIEFRPFVNKTKQEFEGVLDEFVKSPQLIGVDCVFIIVSSHGGVDPTNKDFIKSCDNKIIFNDSIIDKFNNINCSKLRLIPKIFIFQTCRGRKYDYGCKYIPDDVPSAKLSTSKQTQFDGKEPSLTLNTYSDILSIYSTMQGFASFRDKVYGSWYFIAMCNVFVEYAHNTHIMDLFAMVDKELQKIDFEKDVIQTSQITAFSFNNHLFLNPGYFGD